MAGHVHLYYNTDVLTGGVDDHITIPCIKEYPYDIVEYVFTKER